MGGWTAAHKLYSIYYLYTNIKTAQGYMSWAVFLYAYLDFLSKIVSKTAIPIPKG